MIMQSYLYQQKLLVKELENFFSIGNYKSTLVKMQSDYANDNQICLTSGVFIPDHISKKIVEKVIRPLQKIESIHYFYPSESMHITIKNIRTIHQPPLFNDADIDKANKLFSKIIPSFPIFEFYVEDLILFPTSLCIMAYTNSTLNELILSLDNGLKKIGVPDNKKYISNSLFLGNITVCRFTKKPSQEFINAVRKLRNLKIGSFKVEKICLKTCNAVSHSESRKIIAEYKLKLSI